MKITTADLRRLCPKAKEEIIAPLVTAMPTVLPAYGITTALRFCHFVAQGAEESMGFQTLNELGGSVYFEKMYGPQTAVGRRLGNTQPGDGARYHGRGIFQLTGRANYAALGNKLQLDLVGHPEWAADPAISLRIACEYWVGRKLNALADGDDVVGITRKINGGINGLAERKAFLAKAKTIWPGAWDTPHAAPEDRPAPSAPTPEPVAMPASDPAAPIVVATPPADIPAPVDLPTVVDPPAIDATMENLPAIATDAPPPLTQSKTLIGSATSVISSGGFGYTLSQIFQNPNAVWIVGVAGALLLVGGVALAIVFRERIAKRLELGI